MDGFVDVNASKVLEDFKGKGHNNSNDAGLEKAWRWLLQEKIYALDISKFLNKLITIAFVGQIKTKPP